MTTIQPLLSPNLPIIVAVSGGADSLCLLGKLHEQGYPLIVAHFDHQLRPDSVDDAKFVEELAAQYQLPFLLGTADVNAYAAAHKQTIEEAARNSRYAFFFEQARIHKAQAVAVGHTADDQVETVLMHFLRGAGLNGLKGILPSTILPHFDAEIPLVRPILHLHRADTEAWCAEHDLIPRQDPTNAETDYFRNRLRHELIPELEKYNPNFRNMLVRTTHALQGDHELLSELIDQTWLQIVKDESSTCVSFHLPSFSLLSHALIRNLVRRGMEKLLPGQTDLTFSTLERAAAFIEDANAPQRVDLASGLFLLKEGDALHLTADEQHLPLSGYPQIGGELIPVTVPSKVKLGSSWVLTVSAPETGHTVDSDDPFQVTLDADLLTGALTLRSRNPGDSFSPLGMAGKSVKIKDFFINVKLLQRARVHYPLLCMDDEIVWVPGYRPAHHVRVTDVTRRVIRFMLKQW